MDSGTPAGRPHTVWEKGVEFRQTQLWQLVCEKRSGAVVLLVDPGVDSQVVDNSKSCREIYFAHEDRRKICYQVLGCGYA